MSGQVKDTVNKGMKNDDTTINPQFDHGASVALAAFVTRLRLRVVVAVVL
jgi:hypothetical protein